MSKTGSRHIKQLEVIKAHGLLTEHLEIIVPQVLNDDGVLVTQGLVKYKPGYDDEQLAQQIAPDLPPKSIAGLRIKAFGNLTAPAGSTSENEIIASLSLRMQAAERREEDLMKANTAISQALMALTDKHNKLCETLALNQVAPVRHLTTTAPLKAVG